jgi:hypothetical protein
MRVFQASHHFMFCWIPLYCHIIAFSSLSLNLFSLPVSTKASMHASTQLKHASRSTERAESTRLEEEVRGATPFSVFFSILCFCCQSDTKAITRR